MQPCAFSRTRRPGAALDARMRPLAGMAAHRSDCLVRVVPRRTTPAASRPSPSILRGWFLPMSRRSGASRALSWILGSQRRVLRCQQLATSTRAGLGLARVGKGWRRRPLCAWRRVLPQAIGQSLIFIVKSSLSVRAPSRPVDVESAAIRRRVHDVRVGLLMDYPMHGRERATKVLCEMTYLVALGVSPPDGGDGVSVQMFVSHANRSPSCRLGANSLASL